jgi:hypothetical protein
METVFAEHGTSSPAMAFRHSFPNSFISDAGTAIRFDAGLPERLIAMSAASLPSILA